DADRGGEDAPADVVALESGARPARERQLLGERVARGGADARPDALPDPAEDVGDDRVRGPHALDLFLRLEEDHASAASRSRETSSRVRVPSISRSRPARR